MHIFQTLYHIVLEHFISQVLIYVIVKTTKFLVPDIPDDVWKKMKDERDSFISHKDGRPFT